MCVATVLYTVYSLCSCVHVCVRVFMSVFGVSSWDSCYRLSNESLLNAILNDSELMCAFI